MVGGAAVWWAELHAWWAGLRAGLGFGGRGPMLGGPGRGQGSRFGWMGAHRRQAWEHTCCSSLLKAAQNLLTQEMNQPSHNLRVEKEQTPNHTF